MYGYKVEIKQICTHSEYSDEQFGDWSESYENSAPSYIVKEDKYPDVTTTLEFEHESTGYIVWAEWSTGDSFGHGTNSNTDVIGLFKDKKSAEALRDFLRKSKNTEGYEYDFVTPDLQEFKGYAGWVGYFDSLTDIHVDEVLVFDEPSEVDCED